MSVSRVRDEMQDRRDETEAKRVMAEVQRLKDGPDGMACRFAELWARQYGMPDHERDRLDELAHAFEAGKLSALS